MIKGILSIAGKPGLYKLVSQGKNMLIVESLADGKRRPAYSHDKVISLADVAIYTTGEDMPLAEVFEKVKTVCQGQPVNIKDFPTQDSIRGHFKTILPEFDEDRVHTSDIKKLYGWYNTLLNAGIDSFIDDSSEEGTEEEATGNAPTSEAEASSDKA